MMSMHIYEALDEYISTALKNNFTDNWDEYRYGKESLHKKEAPGSFLSDIKDAAKNQLCQTAYFRKYFSKKYLHAFKETIDRFSFLYDHLEDELSKKKLVNVLAYRILGHKKVKIDLGAVDYKTEMAKIEQLFEKNDFVLPDQFQIKQQKINLQQMGYPISMYLSGLGIFYDFVFKQYEINREGLSIKVLPGDTVIDGGGCFGDTALYFSYLAGSTGKVFSFEFIPDNISLFKKNTELNPSLKDSIYLSPFPLWDKSDLDVFYKDKGPGSIVSFTNDFAYDGVVKTVSLDDFAERNQIAKVGFIKLDIEGAELNALQGATKTLVKDQPKLAIALYHDEEDFNRIPRFIKSINPGYKFYFHHATINIEESVLFAV